MTKINSSDVVAQSQNKAPVMAGARYFIHVLPDCGVKRMFQLASEALAPGGVFVSLYNVTEDVGAQTETKGEIFMHDRRRVELLAHRSGFRTIFRSCETSPLATFKGERELGYVTQIYRLV